VKIAIIGAGIAGNVAAYQLHRKHDITVFEAADYIGGHTQPHSLQQHGSPYQVDTGFIVFNERNYPGFTRLLQELGVASQPSTMSFSVHHEPSGLQYNGTNLDGLFAQRRNALRPSFWRMLSDIVRFNREAPRLLHTDSELTIGDYLQANRYSHDVIQHYLVPIGAAIWSTDPEAVLSFPARFFVGFLQNHGMLSLTGRPQWRVITGGSARYVARLTAGFRQRIRLGTPIELVRRTPGHVLVRPGGQLAERYDYAFLACHSDQALAMLADPEPCEREVLGAIPYRVNDVVLHTDQALLPTNHRAHAAWNYHALSGSCGATLTYDMNRLQSLDAPDRLLVTLNRTAAIDPRKILRQLTYSHPQFTTAAARAQRRHREINGRRRTYFCGAYWGFGFHEDGLVSAMTATRHFEEDLQHAGYQAERSA
jgi:predicted NAD/FAD-binding protein